jgi:hypothetical protein
LLEQDDANEEEEEVDEALPTSTRVKKVLNWNTITKVFEFEP